MIYESSIHFFALFFAWNLIRFSDGQSGKRPDRLSNEAQSGSLGGEDMNINRRNLSVEGRQSVVTAHSRPRYLSVISSEPLVQGAPDTNLDSGSDLQIDTPMGFCAETSSRGRLDSGVAGDQVTGSRPRRETYLRQGGDAEKRFLDKASKYGLPSRRNLMLYGNFVLSYNCTLKHANWVLQHLTPQRLQHLQPGTPSQPVARTSHPFHLDECLEEHFQIRSEQYGSSGYDRGHMCPARDNVVDSKWLDQSFCMTNIVPQLPKFNRNVWRILEEYVDELALHSKNMYVVTGAAYLKGEHEIKKCIKKLGMSIPTHFFKVWLLEDTSGQRSMKAYLLPHEESDTDVSLEDYRISIDDVLPKLERSTGLVFFDEVDRNRIAKPDFDQLSRYRYRSNMHFRSEFYSHLANPEACKKAEKFFCVASKFGLPSQDYRLYGNFLRSEDKRWTLNCLSPSRTNDRARSHFPEMYESVAEAWSGLESYISKRSRKCRCLYVVTGAYGIQPRYFYKVLLLEDVQGDFSLEAFRVENNPNATIGDLSEIQVDIDGTLGLIERESGLKFFDKIDRTTVSKPMLEK